MRYRILGLTASIAVTVGAVLIGPPTEVPAQLSLTWFFFALAGLMLVVAGVRRDSIRIAGVGGALTVSMTLCSIGMPTIWPVIGIAAVLALAVVITTSDRRRRQRRVLSR